MKSTKEQTQKTLHKILKDNSPSEESKKKVEVLSGNEFKDFLSNQLASLKKPKIKQTESQTDLTKNSNITIIARSVYTSISRR